MKRLLLVMVLALALLCLLATPALALRPSTMTAYVVPKTGGVWLEAQGDLNAPTLLVHPPGSPIPANYDVIIDAPWRGITRGLVQTVPLALLYQVSIPAADVDISQDEAQAYWSGAVLWDRYWSSLLGPIPAFNPRTGVQAYANHWWGPLTGDAGTAANLTSDKKLPPGTYAGLFTETVVRTIIDLKLNSAGQTTPVKVKPGTASYPFTFVVAPPVE
jgi:hypothetical protein